MDLPLPLAAPLRPHQATPLELRARLAAERRGAPFLIYRDGEGLHRLIELTATSAQRGGPTRAQVRQTLAGPAAAGPAARPGEHCSMGPPFSRTDGAACDAGLFVGSRAPFGIPRSSPLRAQRETRPRRHRSNSHGSVPRMSSAQHETSGAGRCIAPGDRRSSLIRDQPFLGAECRRRFRRGLVTHARLGNPEGDVLGWLHAHATGDDS